MSFRDRSEFFWQEVRHASLPRPRPCTQLRLHYHELISAQTLIWLFSLFSLSINHLALCCFTGTQKLLLQLVFRSGNVSIICLMSSADPGSGGLPPRLWQADIGQSIDHPWLSDQTFMSICDTCQHGRFRAKQRRVAEIDSVDIFWLNWKGSLSPNWTSLDCRGHLSGSQLTYHDCLDRLLY